MILETGNIDRMSGPHLGFGRLLRQRGVGRALVVVGVTIGGSFCGVERVPSRRYLWGAETPSERRARARPPRTPDALALGPRSVRRDGKESAGQGDLGDEAWSFIKQIGGMACRDQAIDTTLEKLFPRLGRHQRILVKQLVVHILEGDFKASSFARDVGRDELVEYIKAHEPGLEAPAQFTNFLFDVYLQRTGS